MDQVLAIRSNLRLIDGPEVVALILNIIECRIAERTEDPGLEEPINILFSTRTARGCIRGKHEQRQETDRNPDRWATRPG